MEFKDKQHPDIKFYFVNHDKKGWDLRVQKTLI